MAANVEYMKMWNPLETWRLVVRRRFVGAITIIAFAFGVLACPLSGEGWEPTQGDASSQLVGQTEHLADRSRNHDADSCCKFWAQASALVQPPVAVPATHAMWSSLPVALISRPAISVSGEYSARIMFFANGPPRTHKTVFDTFWAHAPPADQI